MLATAGIKGFAFTLGVGTLTSMFTAVLFTSALMGSLSRTRLLNSRFALGAQGEGRPWTFDFMGKSKWFFSMSGVILLIGALAIAGKGINFGIDFESGTRIKTPIEQAASTEDVRDALPSDLQDAEVQEVEEPELGENVFQISTETLEPEEVDERPHRARRGVRRAARRTSPPTRSARRSASRSRARRSSRSSRR